MTSSQASIESRLVRAAALLERWRDVLEERVADETPPAWALRRGWDAFLTGLPDDALARCELEGAGGLDSKAAPATLVELARDVQGVADVTVRVPRVAEPLHGVSRRKCGQVAALVELCREHGFAPGRVVDVGAGTGHLTRALARELDVEALGIERDATRVERARALSAGERAPRFEARTVEASLVLERGDLAVGLHACGALGDTLVAVSARDGVDLVLVACCPQKVPGAERTALSRTGREHGLTIPRTVLGLANAFEGEPDLEGRAIRIALRRLLRARGAVFRPGEETHGLTPRHRRKLATAAERALARRGLAAASPAEQEAALAGARESLDLARRRSLPRRFLGNALEVALALDRARALEEAGGEAQVVRLFPRALSPRNLAVVARARATSRPRRDPT